MIGNQKITVSYNIRAGIHYFAVSWFNVMEVQIMLCLEYLLISFFLTIVNFLPNFVL